MANDEIDDGPIPVPETKPRPFAVGDEVTVVDDVGPMAIRRVDRVQQFARRTKITVGDVAFNDVGTAWNFSYHSPRIRHTEPGDRDAIRHENLARKALRAIHRLGIEQVRKLSDADLREVIRIFAASTEPK